MEQLKLYQTPEHDCPYLPEQQAVTQFIDPSKQPSIELYTHLSKFGFRRSGDHLYKPSCPNCDACISVRLPVNEVTLSKSQKRCIKNSKDLTFSHIAAFDSDEHYELYEQYINARHKGGDMYPPTRELFRNFLLSNWSNSQFMEIRLDSILIGCGVYDRLTDGLSAVYCYFDHLQSKRSIGKLSILKQIKFAQDNNLKYLYLGYQINECSKMNYKTNYKPVEQFIKMQWRRID